MTIQPTELRRHLARLLLVSEEELFARGRGQQETAAERALAMYLAVITADISQAKAGIVFGRDRTTVGHALRRVEDLRDDPAFDAKCDRLERDLRRAMKTQVTQ